MKMIDHNECAHLFPFVWFAYSYVLGWGSGLQVELNIEFVQRKRDDATFSPKDHQFVESFLQVLSLFPLVFRGCINVLVTYVTWSSFMTNYAD